MKKLMKYLKTRTGVIFAVCLLLLLQAYADLALPEYISRIVDTGIQLGGIESSAPAAVKEDTYGFLLSAVSEEEQAVVSASYERKEQGSISEREYKKLVKKYPSLENGAIYIRKDLSKSELKKAEAVFTKAWIAMLPMMAANNPEMAEQMGGGADLSILPESMQEQAAKAVVKGIYEDIGMDMDAMQINFIIRAGVEMLLLAALVMITSIAVGFLSAKIGSGVARDIRRDIFGKVVSFTNSEFDKHSTASLITRSTNDVQQVQMLVIMSLRIVLYAPILGLGGVYKVFQTNTSMAWIIGLAVLVIMGIVLVLLGVAMPKFKAMQKLVDRLNLVSREILTGLSVIRAFSTEKHEEKRFDAANRDLTKTSLFVNRTMAFMMPVMMLVMNAVTVLILWSGGKGIDTGEMQVGDMMAFMQYTMQIIMSFLMLCMMSVMLPRAMVSATRIAEVLDTEASVTDKENTVSFDESKKGLVEFEHVNFRYPGAEEDALSDITFTAKPGATTAIIGSTGSGKSTLINLIPRFYDVSGGSIRVNGRDIREVSSKKLRDKIGLVPQKGILFSGSIESNLRYGKQEADREEIERAVRIAQAKDFIEEKPEGYESTISQGGSNVSGGQKQRLAIARSIVKNPDIFIFDDSFSALDYKTDSVLRKTLKEEISESTIMIVAQRISTVLHADLILVLDEGKIVGQGSHTELMESCEVYRQIAASQLSEKEIASLAPSAAKV